MLAQRRKRLLCKGTQVRLLIYGTADEVVPYQQSEEMAARLEAAGVPVELILIPDVGHSFIGKTHADTRAATLRAVHATFDFIDKTIDGDK
jgi:dipeptidyl aminopeptidase/acylaminoacyl peptidase